MAERTTCLFWSKLCDELLYSVFLNPQDLTSELPSAKEMQQEKERFHSVIQLEKQVAFAGTLSPCNATEAKLQTLLFTLIY